MPFLKKGIYFLNKFIQFVEITRKNRQKKPLCNINRRNGKKMGDGTVKYDYNIEFDDESRMIKKTDNMIEKENTISTMM